MKKITKATLHYTLDGKRYTCWTTIERANVFLLEAKKRNVEAHAKAALLDVNKGLDGIAIPFHPGAEKYYKEKGVLN